MEAKICGIKDKTTLNFIISHKYAPRFIGFICNYPKSHRNLKLKNLISLINLKKKKVKFVAVLVSPKLSLLKKITKLNFDYFQLYNVSPKKTLIIKKKFKKKIISVIQVHKKRDVINYKEYMNIARGGYFKRVPNKYPSSAFYTYYDKTCDYACQVTEFTYWVITSLRNQQSGAERKKEIKNEWKLYDRKKIEKDFPELLAFFSNPKFGIIF